MFRKQLARPALVLSLLLSFSASELRAEGELEILFSNIPGHATNQVPGMPGVQFLSGATFFELSISPDGTHWATKAFVNLPSDENEIYLIDGQVALQEGHPTSFGLFPASLERRIDIADTGKAVFTHGYLLPNLVVAIDASGTGEILVREGDLISGYGELDGAVWGEYFYEPIVDRDGHVGFIAARIEGLLTGTTHDSALIFNRVVLARKGISVPTDQVGTNEPWSSIGRGGDVTASGDRWSVAGRINPGSGNISLFSVDGEVVIQQGVPLAGSSFTAPVAGMNSRRVFDPAGNWYMRGTNQPSQQDWAVRNGVVLAYSQGSDEIIAGSGEHWDDTHFVDCFHACTGDGLGNYIIAGETDAPVDSNAVVVLNGSRVICREGDPIDLDGNGLLDDDAFVSFFDRHSVYLLDDGSLFMELWIKDGQGSFLGSSIVRSPSPYAVSCNGGGDGLGCTACPCGNDPASETIGGCLNSAVQSARLLPRGIPSASADTMSFHLKGAVPGVTAILASATNLLPQSGACPAGSGITSAAFDGLRCIGGALRRHGGQVVDGNGRVGITNSGWGADGTTAPGLITTSGFSVGQARNFQVIYRDQTLAGCVAGLNTSQAISVTIQP